MLICDWHYEAPGVYGTFLAVKGSSGNSREEYTLPATTVNDDLLSAGGATLLQQRYTGMMHTVWSSFPIS